MCSTLPILVTLGGQLDWPIPHLACIADPGNGRSVASGQRVVVNVCSTIWFVDTCAVDAPRNFDYTLRAGMPKKHGQLSPDYPPFALPGCLSLYVAGEEKLVIVYG